MAKPNWKNRTIFIGDNLNVLKNMSSKSVDLIYLDPPFKSNKKYEGKNRTGFKDTWSLRDIDATWLRKIALANPALHDLIKIAASTHSDSMKAYLVFMGIRLLELHRILKETGSIYLHCDPTASHYLKIMMDAVFGTDNFKNDIVWRVWLRKIALANPALHDLIKIEPVHIQTS